MRHLTCVPILAAALAISMAVPLSSASAAGGPLARRGDYANVVITPAMMHAINLLVAEDMKMRHHRR